MSRSFDAVRKADADRQDTGPGPVEKPAVEAPQKQEEARSAAAPDARPTAARPESRPAPARPQAAPTPAAPASRGALVPLQSPGGVSGFRRRFAGWLERFSGTAEKRDGRQAESHAELRKRIDELEKKLAAAEERFGKQLAESEGRSLHLMEQRAQSMHEELTESQRKVAQRVVTREVGSLRGRVHVATFLSLAAGAAAAYALLVLLGLLPR